MDRFWSKVDVRGPDDCWPWLASKVPAGYGKFRLDGRTRPAHVVAFLLEHGREPDGLLDHTCHDPELCEGGVTCPHRPCCNPRHAVESSARVNTGPGRSVRAKRHDSCARGHDLTNPANVQVRASGARQCRVCANAWKRRKRAEGRATPVRPWGPYGKAAAT